LPQLEFAALQLRRVVGRLVVIPQQVFVVRPFLGGRREKVLRQDDASPGPRPIRPVTAFANAIETIAGRDYPRIRGRAAQVLAEVLEDRWVLGGQRGKVVNRLVHAGREAGSCYVVPQDASVHDLREERRSGQQLPHQMRNVFLALGGKRLLIARTAAECDDDDLMGIARRTGPRERSGRQ
jgi:hypothetical protein